MTPTIRSALVAVVAVSLLLAACSSSGVIQTNPGTYMVSATGTSPAFTGTEDAIRKAYREAAEFCGQDAREVETISLDKVEQAIGRPGRATLHFRCLEPDAPSGS